MKYLTAQVSGTAMLQSTVGFHLELAGDAWGSFEPMVVQRGP